MPICWGGGRLKTNIIPSQDSEVGVRKTNPRVRSRSIHLEVPYSIYVIDLKFRNLHVYLSVHASVHVQMDISLLVTLGKTGEHG